MNGLLDPGVASGTRELSAEESAAFDALWNASTKAKPEHVIWLDEAQEQHFRTAIAHRARMQALADSLRALPPVRELARAIRRTLAFDPSTWQMETFLPLRMLNGKLYTRVEF